MTHTDIGVAEQKEILSRLYAAGCRKVVIGFESIVSDSLLHMEKWKYARLPQYAKAIETIQSYGIGVWGTFIVGLDHDDRSVFQKVIDFTLENHLYGAMISVPTPFPGSALYAQLEQEGRILTKHWGELYPVECGRIAKKYDGKGFGRWIFPHAARHLLEGSLP